MYADKYRKRNLTPFEKVAYRNLHRAVVMEQGNGGAHIDTCNLCKPHGCTGDCDQGRACTCQVGMSEAPSPLEPQPVQQRKPSLLERIGALWERFKARHIDNGNVYD